MKTLVTMLSISALFLISSCGNKEETAADYGKKFCDCVKEKEGMHEDCAKIMDEARKKFPDGKDEFMEVAKDCMK